MIDETQLNDEQAQEFDLKLQETLADTGLNQLQELQEEIQGMKGSLKDDRKAISTMFLRYIYEELEDELTEGYYTIGRKYTVKNGTVYTYGESSRTRGRYVAKEQELLEEHVGEEAAEIGKMIRELYDIDMKAKVKRKLGIEDFDALTYTTKTGNYGGFQLIDALGGRSSSCDKTKIELEPERFCELRRSIKFQPVMKEMMEEVLEELKQREERANELMDEIEQLAGAA